MPDLPEPHRTAVGTLADGLADAAVDWALTGSASFALQGVPVTPDDVDVQTSADGASAIAERFEDRVVDPVEFSEGEKIRSHFGRLRVEGVTVEVMGGLQKRAPDGTWDGPTDVTDHREYCSLDGRRVPVLSLAYEARAYDRLGRDERAALLREYAGRD